VLFTGAKAGTVAVEFTLAAPFGCFTAALATLALVTIQTVAFAVELTMMRNTELNGIIE
jgi:hypothetical protein